MSIEDHLEQVEQHTHARLAEAGIYDIDSYGWLNADEPDPELIGHAMWQTSQPSLEYTALLGEVPVSRRPRDYEKQILVAGDDFTALMQSSRLSIGLMLAWAPNARKDPFGDNKFFWTYYLDAMLKLAIASDRIRDLLVISCAGEDAQTYARKHRLYADAYVDASKLLANRGFNDERARNALSRLPEQGPAVFAFIANRNRIVHEVATRVASQTRQSVSELQQQFDDQQTSGFQARIYDTNAMLASSAAFTERRDLEVGTAIAEVAEWYKLLVNTSNCIFQIEYWSRTLLPRA